MNRVLTEHELKVADVVHQPIHGGSLRVYAVKAESDSQCSLAVDNFLALEKGKGFFGLDPYHEFACWVKLNKDEILALVSTIKAGYRRIAGYGASAKGKALLKCQGIDSSTLEYIIDDNWKKHGYYTPRAHIPIVAPERLSRDQPDYLLLLAWNFAKEMLQRTTAYQQEGGSYIVPVPHPIVLH